MDLSKVPLWRLERDSKPRPSYRNAWSLPMRHYSPQTMHERDQEKCEIMNIIVQWTYRPISRQHMKQQQSNSAKLPFFDRRLLAILDSKLMGAVHYTRIWGL